MTQELRVSREELFGASCRALMATGMSEAAAGSASEILVLADLMGIGTHGVSRLDLYTQRLRRGAFRLQADVEVVEATPSMAVVEGDGALGAVVGQTGLQTALRLVGHSGIAFVSCRNSNHFGALAPYAFLACQAGMICILGTAATTTIAPWGGREVKLGNNPFGVGAPRQDAFPFILDMAISTSARAKIRKARDEGRQIPEGWALDAEGNPTTDPIRALDGFLMPIGGHKGYGLALAVDLLCGVASGGRFLSEIQTWVTDTGQPQGLGHFFILIDPDRLIGRDLYNSRMADFCRIIKETEPLNAEKPVLLPGEPEGNAYRDRIENGIPIKTDQWEALNRLAEPG